MKTPAAGRAVLPKAVGDSCEPQRQRHKKTPSFLTPRGGLWVGCCNVDRDFCSHCSFSRRFVRVLDSCHVKNAELLCANLCAALCAQQCNFGQRRCAIWLVLGCIGMSSVPFLECSALTFGWGQSIPKRNSQGARSMCA